MRRFSVFKSRKLLTPATLSAYKRVSDRKKIENRLDSLFRQIIKKRDKKCVRCGKDRNLQTSHIFSRSNKSVRWDENNVVLFCGYHHIFWWHKNPIEAISWIQKYLGSEKYEALKIKAGFVIHRNVNDLLFLEQE